jgi:hypothetical protein
VGDVSNQLRRLFSLSPEARQAEKDAFDRLLELLRSGDLWHTTTPCRYRQIRSSGCIVPDPPNLVGRRFGGESQAEWPVGRSVGGVCLFDFCGFDPEGYVQQYPLSDWRVFLPFNEPGYNAIWMKIDRSALPGQLLSPDEVRRLSEQTSPPRKYFPRIERVHVGSIPTTAFNRTLAVAGSLNEISVVSEA